MSSSPRKRARPISGPISPSDNGNLSIDPSSPLVPSFEPIQTTSLQASIVFPSSSPLQTSFDSPTRKRRKPRIQTSPESKSVKVESYPRLYISDFKICGKTERFQHAKEYADSLDTTTSLDPANSTIQRHALTTIDSSPASVYLHTNSKQYINELLVDEELEETQDAVMRVFLECLSP